MEYRILGPLEVIDDGQRLALGGARQKALLGILLLNANEVISVDRLLDEVWGDEPPETGPKALQVAISQLRKSLVSGAGENGVLATVSPGYVLRVGENELDRDRFTRLMSEARLEDDPRARGAKFREALTLWRGEPLSDLAYEGFAQPAIANLQEARVAALEERIDADLEAGQDAGLVGELDELVARYPLRERLRALLMVALYRSGRQADALSAYQDARHILVEELGVEPGRELQDLQRAVLEHDPALGGARKLRAPTHSAERPPRRRSWILPGALVLVLLAVVAVVAGLALKGGPAAVVVPPNAVATIDPGSNEVVDAIPVESSPGPIATGDGMAWVVNESAGTVSVIDLDAREVTLTQAFNFGNGPSIAVRGDGRSVWLGQTQSPFVEPWYRPDAAGFATVRIGDPGTSAVAALAFDGATLLAADVAGALVTIQDDDFPAVDARVELPRQPVALAAGAGFAWVANQGRTVSRVDIGAGAAAEATVGVRPTAIAFGEESVWVANGSDGTVSRLAPIPLRVTATIKVGRDPTAIAVGEGAVWVANGLDGTVSRIDPRSNEVVATIRVGHRPLGVAVDNGLVWVTVRE